MPFLPIEYLLSSWGPGTCGGIHSHYSQYPLGLLCQQSDQASMWTSLHFILTEVKNLFFHPSSFAFPSHSIFNYMYYCIVSLFPFSALTFTWPIFVSRFWLNSILNICGYGMVPIAMYSNCWMVVFLPSKHSSGKAAFWVYDNNLLGRKGIKEHICIWKGK